MTDTLLFLHVLSAACLFAAIYGFSSLVLGGRMEPGGLKITLALWHVGLVGVFIFGIWLALRVDGIEIWDAWILIAIALWMTAGGTGDKVPAAYREAGGGAIPARVVRMHWISVIVVVLLLADMIWKPWT